MTETTLLTADTLSALWVTLKLASVTTVVLMLLATPVAWWLSQTT